MGRKSNGYKKMETYGEYESSPFTEMTGIGRATLRHPEFLLQPVSALNGSFIQGADNEGKVKGFIGTPYMGTTKLLDRRTYVKWYDGLSYDLMRDSEFGANGYRVLLYITHTVKKDSIEVVLYPAGVCRTTGMNRGELYSGIADLLRVNVIARKKDSSELYWLNPQYIFRGDRSKLLK